MNKLFLILVVLLSVVQFASADLTFRTDIRGTDHMSSETTTGDVREVASGEGNYSYSATSSQTDAQTFQSTYSLDAKGPAWTNMYRVSANNKDVGAQQSFSAANMKSILAKTQIGSNSGLLQTDIRVSGIGNANSEILQSIGQPGTVHNHFDWAYQSTMDGNWSFHQGLTATSSIYTIPNAGNWLESNGAAQVYENGTQVAPVTEPTGLVISAPMNLTENVTKPATNNTTVPKSDEFKGEVTSKIDANGLPAYRLTDHPELAHYLNSTTVWQTCPDNGFKFTEIKDPILGRVDLYDL